MMYMRKIYRLQAIGGSYYIALPKEWLKRFNLDKGSHVEVIIESDGSLRIKTVETSKEVLSEDTLSKVDIEIKNKDTVFSLLIWLYLSGYDMITLRFRESSMGSVIRGAINRAKNILLGFEIVDEDSSSIVLHVLASSGTDVYTIIKNMNRIARSMYLDTLFALLEKDIEKAYEVEARDQDLNRLYFYITRVIRKKATSSTESEKVLELMDLRLIAKSIEEIGDDAKRAAKIVQEIIMNDISLDKSMVENLKTYVDELDTIYKNTINRIEKLSPLPELIETLSKCEKITQKLSNFRRDVISINTSGSSYISELVYIYENIAMHLYDIISLVPATIQ